MQSIHVVLHVSFSVINSTVYTYHLPLISVMVIISFNELFPPDTSLVLDDFWPPRVLIDFHLRFSSTFTFSTNISIFEM